MLYTHQYNLHNFMVDNQDKCHISVSSASDQMFNMVTISPSPSRGLALFYFFFTMSYKNY